MNDWFIGSSCKRACSLLHLRCCSPVPFKDAMEIYLDTNYSWAFNLQHLSFFVRTLSDIYVTTAASWQPFIALIRTSATSSFSNHIDYFST